MTPLDSETKCVHTNVNSAFEHSECTQFGSTLKSWPLRPKFIKIDMIQISYFLKYIFTMVKAEIKIN